MDKETINKYSPSEYAKLVGVVPGRVTQLKAKLDKVVYIGGWLVLDTAGNRQLFKSSHLLKNK